MTSAADKTGQGAGQAVQRRTGNGNGNGNGGDSGARSGVLDWLRGKLRGRNGDSLRETLEEILEESEREYADESGAPIGGHERVMLANILNLRRLTAYDVMVPRADIVAVQVNSGLEDLIALMGKQGHSRLPVYRDNLDDVVGLVHIKDVLAHVGDKRRFKMQRITRDVLYVAPSMPVLDLLLEMRLERVHMALVVDEFGGIDGLVTIEDLVEEIVGEIEDEHDVAESPKITRQEDGTLLADGRIEIDEFEQVAGEILTEEERAEDIDTLGGLVFTLAGRVPTRGELIEHATGVIFEVLDADPRRIKRLRVRNLNVHAAAAEDDG
ncbi:MAG: hemolysin family protein [Rhodovibrionaceae bacterium]|nr:hemolysin family protein [Rhodovibrionaceae bacterium]